LWAFPGPGEWRSFGRMRGSSFNRHR